MFPLRNVFKRNLRLELIVKRSSRIKYISASNIRPALASYVIYFISLLSSHPLWVPSLHPRASRGSAIHVFLASLNICLVSWLCPCFPGLTVSLVCWSSSVHAWLPHPLGFMGITTLPSQQSCVAALYTKVEQQDGIRPALIPTTPLQHKWVTGLYESIPQHMVTVGALGATWPLQHMELVRS